MVKDICYTTSNDYVKPMAASIASFVENHKGAGELVFHVILCGVEETNKELLREMGADLNVQIKLYDVDMRTYMTRKAYDGRLPLSTYARFFIGDIISEEIESVLYLDCDTLVLGDLAELLNARPEEGKCILGKTDRAKAQYLAQYIESYANNKDMTQRGMEQPPSRYINDGVMLIDLSQWRKLELRKKLMDGYETISEEPSQNDQYLVNFFAQDYIDESMDEVYNSIGAIDPSQINQAYLGEKGFKILHYGGYVWVLQRRDFQRIFLKYYRKTPWKNTRHISPLRVAKARTGYWLQNNGKAIYSPYLFIRGFIKKAVSHGENAVK